jgi:C_GCAxxG_C_C family probable redox protein
MTSVEVAMTLFEEGFNCAQAVFAAHTPNLGLERETALKMAAPFGGGVGRMGEICGAVSGALMALGLRHASIQAEDKQSKEQVYLLSRELANRFGARNNGCIKCRELLGCEIGTPEGLQAAREHGLFETLCPKFVRDAAEIAEQLCNDKELV